LKETDKTVYLLFSGGLDSILASRVLKDLGFKVIGVFVELPFYERKPSEVKNFSKFANLDELLILKAGEDYLEIVKNPKFGYGKGANPCIDCRAYMLKRVKEIAKGAIIATGEVLGQRPKSQKLSAFRKVEKLCELEGRVLRPLSGKILPETVYEKEGIVSREKLLSIKGRSRKKQIELLKKFGLDFGKLPTPSGGCLLTDPQFSKRVFDLIEHEELNMDNAELLKLGRHFRLGTCKLVLGRNEAENKKLLELKKEEDYLLKAMCPSPVGILRGKECNRYLELAGKILARYSDCEQSATIRVEKNSKVIKTFQAEKLESVEDYRI